MMLLEQLDRGRYGLGLSNIADASVSQMWNTYFYSRLNFYDA